MCFGGPIWLRWLHCGAVHKLHVRGKCVTELDCNFFESPVIYARPQDSFFATKKKLEAVGECSLAGSTSTYSYSTLPSVLERVDKSFHGALAHPEGHSMSVAQSHGQCGSN